MGEEKVDQHTHTRAVYTLCAVLWIFASMAAWAKTANRNVELGVCNGARGVLVTVKFFESCVFLQTADGVECSEPPSFVVDRSTRHFA